MIGRKFWCQWRNASSKVAVEDVNADVQEVLDNG